MSTPQKHILLLVARATIGRLGCQDMSLVTGAWYVTRGPCTILIINDNKIYNLYGGNCRVYVKKKRLCKIRTPFY